MKKIYLVIILINFFGCLRVGEKTKILSFQNKWGVAYYFFPRFPGDGCRYRVGFLPLKNLADTNSIKDSSSIFDFRFESGINFLSDNPTFRNQIYTANPKKYIYENGNTNHHIYWAFMKLQYHIDATIAKPEIGDLYNDTLIFNNHHLPVQFYQLWSKIVIDTAFGRKKYINPLNDPKFRSKMNKYIMPCFLIIK